MRVSIRLRVGAPCKSLHILKETPGMVSTSFHRWLVLLVRLALKPAEMRAVLVGLVGNFVF